MKTRALPLLFWVLSTGCNLGPPNAAAPTAQGAPSESVNGTSAREPLAAKGSPERNPIVATPPSPPPEQATALPQASANPPGTPRVVAAQSEGQGGTPLKGGQHFGRPISQGSPVALSDIAKDPTRYKGKVLLTTGTVKAVCQERGCWMELVDGKGDANVRMHGHSFFVPRDSKGKRARVEGTVQLVKDGKECDEMSATGAHLQLDALGVEIL